MLPADPSLFMRKITVNDSVVLSPKAKSCRVTVVWGGAGGAWLAFFISFLSLSLSLVSILEKNIYIKKTKKEEHRVAVLWLSLTSFHCGLAWG